MTRAKTKAGLVPVDPPPPKVDWQAIAEGLRSKPGQWFHVPDVHLTSTVRAAQQGKIAAVRPNLGFRFNTENNKRGDPAKGIPRTCDLNMMYDPDRADPVAVILHESKGKN